MHFWLVLFCWCAQLGTKSSTEYKKYQEKIGQKVKVHWIPEVDDFSLHSKLNWILNNFLNYLNSGVNWTNSLSLLVKLWKQQVRILPFNECLKNSSKYPIPNSLRIKNQVWIGLASAALPSTSLFIYNIQISNHVRGMPKEVFTRFSLTSTHLFIS